MLQEKDDEITALREQIAEFRLQLVEKCHMIKKLEMELIYVRKDSTAADFDETRVQKIFVSPVKSKVNPHA